jgi:hypothetical protein
MKKKTTIKIDNKILGDIDIILLKKSLRIEQAGDRIYIPVESTSEFIHYLKDNIPVKKEKNILIGEYRRKLIIHILKFYFEYMRKTEHPDLEGDWGEEIKDLIEDFRDLSKP